MQQKVKRTFTTDSMEVDLMSLPESFLLFSQSRPSQNLGFLDSKSTVLQVEVAGRDLSINQSPTLLATNRKGGTTGAGQTSLLEDRRDD